MNIPHINMSKKVEPEINDNDAYKFIELYFKQKNVMFSHLYNSFDKLLDEDIRTYLQLMKHVFFTNVTKDEIIEYGFDFTDVVIKPPYVDLDDAIMLPQDARIKSLTYASKIVATISQYQKTTNIATGLVIKKEIGKPEYEYHVTTLPIMVRSKYCSLNLKKGSDETECRYDPGGYFIIKGNEKVAIPVERMIFNRPLMFIKKDGANVIYNIQINSKSQTVDNMQIINITMKKGSSLIIKVPILADVPVFILMRALGIESDNDIIDYCVYDKDDVDMINIIKISLENSKYEGIKGDVAKNTKILTQTDARNYLMSKIKIIKKYSSDPLLEKQEKKLHLEQLLKENFLPHIESDKLLEKGFYLGYMVNKILQCYLGRTKPDDRDNYINKNVELPGPLIFEIFKQFFKKTMNECNRYFKKRNQNDDTPLNIISQIKSSVIELGLMSVLLTGTWNKRKGVAQPLPRLTYQQTLTALRRINSPSLDQSTNKITGPRHLHASVAGPVCLVGNTLILMGDNTLKLLIDLQNGDVVMTVNKQTLVSEPSKIHGKFERMSDVLFSITTVCGHEIKCTPEHPILVRRGDDIIMVEAELLDMHDKIIIVNVNIEDEFAKYCKFNNKIYDNHEDYVCEFEKCCKWIVKNGVLSVPINDILLCGNEMVYDFTTDNHNHSFVANYFVSSNCFVEVHEGAKVGFIKNLSLIGSITVVKNSQKNVLKNILKNKVSAISDVAAKDLGKYTRVHLNGHIVGLTDNPRKLYLELKEMKYNGSIDPQIGIIHDIRSEIDCKDIRINCETGRIFHPTIRVVNNELMLKKHMVELISTDDTKSTTKITSWNEFIIKFPGVVEYIDTDEKYNAMIAVYPSDVAIMRKRMIESIERVKAMKPQDFKVNLNRYDDFTYVRYSHCEIHPSLLVGIVVSNIPLADRNQSVRLMFQYSQAKQAMGIYTSNYRHRLDISHILYNTQRQIITTRAMKYTNSDKLPAGENVIVAIACYSGYNQEDSNLLNKSALDRGMFVSTSLKKHSTVIQKNQATSQDDLFIKPDESQVIGVTTGTYAKLNDKGYVPEETFIENGDILIAKVSPIQPVGTANKKFKDSSEYYKGGVDGVVDKVYVGIVNNEGYEMRKTRTRSLRIPIIGDKFSICILKGSVTEVMTSLGWVDIRNVTMLHKIATLKDDVLVYELPQSVSNYHYNGKCYKLRSEHVDINCTKCHDLYVKNVHQEHFERVAAVDVIGTQVQFKKWAINDNKDVEFFKLNDLMVKMNDFLILLGTFVNNDMTFNDNVYDEYFKTLNDNLPEFVWSLSQEQCRLLLDNVVKGDIYTTKSKSLADDVMRLAIHAGWSGTIEENGSIIVKIIKTENEPVINDGELIDYDGTVYCLSVSTNVFMIRLNGKNCWIGNCCYTNGHDVLTDKGWSPIEKITMQHKVATLNENHEVHYFHPMSIQEYDHDGNLHVIESKQVNLEVTYNHRMYVNTRNAGGFEIKQAQEIYNKPYKCLKNASSYVHDNIDTPDELKYYGKFTIQNKSFNLYSWLTLFGLHMRYGMFPISCQDMLMKCCNIMNVTLLIDNNEIIIKNDMIAAYLKHVTISPSWLWGLDTKQSKYLLDTIMFTSLQTDDVILIDTVQRLALHAGTSVNYVNSTLVICDDNTPVINGNMINDKLKKYDGKVYCITVPGQGVIYVRKNGLPVWCGNSKFGQKGTNGIQLSAADMMFSESGIQPDLVINPNAIPSRMTMGQIIEFIIGKVAAIEGCEIDGTIFNDLDTRAVKERLKKLGYDEHGLEYLYNGMTGEKMQYRIFIGPNYYQRLRHIVADKIHCLTLDHEVLTSTGWKIFDEIEMDDEIATLCDGVLQYERPIKKLYYPDYEGELYTCEGESVSLSVTGNHRMWVSNDGTNYDFVLAKDVDKNIQYKKDAIWTNDEYDVEDDFLVTFGKWSIGAIVSVDNCTLLGVRGALFPQWVWLLSSRQSQILINAMCVDNVCIISSVMMTDEIMRLALHAGFSADIVGSKKVRINKNVRSTCDHIVREVGRNSVFCLEVSSGIFYVRRNGKACWTGNSRCRGAYTILVRQPTEGRTRGGGLRFGEMERDAMIAHGLGKFLKERLLETSDVYHCHVCNKCGLFAQRMLRKDRKNYSTKKDIYYCQSCKNYTDISKIRIPYAFKLFVQELMAINICPRIRVKKDIGDY